jgi:broad specificity phosphatase PhoE
VIVGVRHAEVANPKGLVYARLPGFRLSTAGREAAGQLAAGLSSAPVTAVYSSPLARAVETAEILAQPFGLPVATDQRLLEWSFWTRWQGMAWTNIHDRDPHLLEAYSRDPSAACPEDTLEATGRRVLAWAEEAERTHPQGLVLGVSHESPLIAAWMVGSGRHLRDYHAANLPHLACVRLEPGPAEVVDLVGWARTC